MKSADAYKKARALALQCYKERLQEDKNPYLPVLDHITVGCTIRKILPPVIREIPIDRIVGTRTAARTEAFAHNFMPLLEAGSEFAAKWEAVLQAQSIEGLREPVQVYELFGRYFVEEGNKRVSVLKFCHAASFPAEVREIILDVRQGEMADLYSHYLQFKDCTGLRQVLMSCSKNYSSLEKILCAGSHTPLNTEESEDAQRQFLAFETAFYRNGGKALKLTSGDAWLLYLDYFGYSKNADHTSIALDRELKAIWEDLEIYPGKKETKVIGDTGTSDRKKRISLRTAPVRVAFIESNNRDSSEWTAEHLASVEKLRNRMKNEIDIQIYTDVNSEEKLLSVMKQAIEDGSEVIFTESPEMLRISNQMAALHPEVRILNCSLNTDTGKLRTYFPRDYEIQLLLGMAAGALTESGHIGYIASYPIYGVAANINAFAIGASMVNPGSSVYLDWSTTQTSMASEFPLDIDLIYIEGEKFDLKSKTARKSGLFDVRTSRFLSLAKIDIHWEVFYEKIIRSILNGSWSVDEQNLASESINYWWGLSNGLLDVTFLQQLPGQLNRLVDLTRTGMATSQFRPFAGELKDQNGQIHNLDSVSLSDLARMDWLTESITGTIPREIQMTQDLEPLVSLHGLQSTKEEEE